MQLMHIVFMSLFSHLLLNCLFAVGVPCIYVFHLIFIIAKIVYASIFSFLLFLCQAKH